MKKLLISLPLLAASINFAQTPCIGCGGGGSVNGQAITPSLVTVNGIAAGYSSPLPHLLNGTMVGKKIMWSGDSTVAITTTKYNTMCYRTSPGQEFSGMLCQIAASYAVDGSHNVTVTFSSSLPTPTNCVVGAYVTNTETATSASNINGAAPSPIYQITATTATTLTFTNPFSSNSTSGAANGQWSCSFMNNGSNGQTQNGFNSASGPGSLQFTNAQTPSLDIHRGMGINDVRTGSTSAAQLQGYIKTYVDSVRANSPNTDILLLSENSLGVADILGTGLVTAVSTTSSTVVGGAGSATITLAAMPNSISGLITPELSLAQEAANTQPISLCQTTGSITGGTNALTVTSGTGCYNGEIITIAGAGAAGGTCTAQIQSGGTTTSLTIAPQCATTVAGAAVAQANTVYSAHLLVDSGSAQEIVPCTAIDTVGVTVTCTFANAHSGTYTVIATQATAAQAYSNIIHDAVMSFVGYAPNVLVVDLQSSIYGRLVQYSSAIMTDQLHPNGTGQDYETSFVANIIQKAKVIGTGIGAGVVAPPGTTRFSTLQQYNPLQSFANMANSYTAPFTYNFRAVENPDYYTLLCSGRLNAYTSASFFDIALEGGASFSGSSFGICPVQQGDIAEFVGGAYSVQLPSGSAVSLNGANTRVTGGATIPAGIPLLSPIRLYRPVYYDSSCESLLKSTQADPYRRRITINAAGNGFLRITSAASEVNGNVLYDPITTSDTVCIQGRGATTSWTSVAQFSTNVFQMNKTGTDFTGWTGWGWVIGNHVAGQNLGVFGEVLNALEFSNGTCTTAATINPANGNNQIVTLTNGQTCALSFTQPTATQTARLTLKVKQSNVSTFNGLISGCKWPGGTVPTITASSAAIDVFSVYLDGTNAYCSTFGQNLQ